MKVGRNEPCPCGSGLKYKNCHLRSAGATDSADRLWQQLHEMALRLPTELIRFAQSRYGRVLFDEAWREFTLFKQEAFDGESIHIPVFTPWFFHEWEPNPCETVVSEADVAEFPLVSVYLKRRGRYEDPLAIRYLQACRDSALSFLDVLDVTPGSGFTIRDVLTGWERSVTEKLGSQSIQTGDIIFARVVTVDTVTVLDGCAALTFPPIEKASIIQLRKHIRKRHRAVTPDVLKDYVFEVLEVYHSIANRLLNPGRPVLANTDGEPLVRCRVTYEIPSARAAFDALRHLSLGYNEAELLADAEFEKNGELRAIEIPWNRRGNAQSVLGMITLGLIQIEGRRLVAEVHSEERGQQFRKIADEALPAGSRYRSTVLDSVEALLEAYRREDPRRAPENELSEDPEVNEPLKEQLRAYYRAWPDMKIPALNGKTPRQAMKTEDGREMVEALLLDFEQKGRQFATFDEDILAGLRATLGLRPRPARV